MGRGGARGVGPPRGPGRGGIRGNINVIAGYKEIQFYSMPFGQTVARMY